MQDQSTEERLVSLRPHPRRKEAQHLPGSLCCKVWELESASPQEDWMQGCLTLKVALQVGSHCYLSESYLPTSPEPIWPVHKGTCTHTHSTCTRRHAHTYMSCMYTHMHIVTHTCHTSVCTHTHVPHVHTHTKAPLPRDQDFPL